MFNLSSRRWSCSSSIQALNDFPSSCGQRLPVPRFVRGSTVGNRPTDFRGEIVRESGHTSSPPEETHPRKFAKQSSIRTWVSCTALQLCHSSSSSQQTRSLLLPPAQPPPVQHDQTGTHPHSIFPILHLPAALPFHLLLFLFLFASQLSTASRMPASDLFSLSAPLYFILGPWGTGAFTAAISRRFDLLQLVIPASISLQCALLPLFLWLRPTPLGPLSFWGSLAGATPRSGSADRFFLRCKPR